MKIHVARFSPHQNAKVFAVFMAVATLVFAIPMFFVFLYMPPGVDSRGNPVGPPPAWIVLLFPLVYFVMGYVMVAIGCWFYNLMVKCVGRIEYETREQ